MRCDSCDFYHSLEAMVGECRESPPKAFPVPVQTISGPSIAFQCIFPRVTPDMWCGAHSDNVDAEEGTAKIITS